MRSAMSSVGASPSLASIHIYPLKAGRAVDLHESAVEPWGLAGDRRWLVVDDGGRFVSQRLPGRSDPPRGESPVRKAQRPGQLRRWLPAAAHRRRLTAGT